jgi:hypothetical protein
MTTSSPPIPAALLHSFFEQATKELHQLSYNDDNDESAKTLQQHRLSVLKIQQSCLSQVVANFESFAIEDVISQLQTMNTHPDAMSLQEPSEEMTNAARQALARVVLQQELYHPTTTTTTNIPLTRTAILEFCGLCQAVVLLDDVQKFLISRNSNKDTTTAAAPLQLYNFTIPKKLLFPQERLQYIQRLFFAALGYDADKANKEIQEIMEGTDDDKDLQQVFGDTIAQLRAVLAKALVDIQQDDLNDFHEGGVTRVVSVSYSESNEMSAPPPTHNYDMVGRRENNNHDDDSAGIQMARQTAALEQTILAQLLQMDVDERTVLVENGANAQDEFMSALESLPKGPERVAYMTSLGSETQHLLLMHRIWQGLINRNKGQPPKMIE